MATKRVENTLGCFDMDPDRLDPLSTSSRIPPMASLSFGCSVCSARMLSVRKRESPALIIVANWRAKIARSFSLTFAGRMLISIFMEALESFVI
jgi:hypothetical protein